MLSKKSIYKYKSQGTCVLSIIFEPTFQIHILLDQNLYNPEEVTSCLLSSVSDLVSQVWNFILLQLSDSFFFIHLFYSNTHTFTCLCCLLLPQLSVELLYTFCPCQFATSMTCMDLVFPGYLAKECVHGGCSR